MFAKPFVYALMNLQSYQIDSKLTILEDQIGMEPVEDLLSSPSPLKCGIFERMLHEEDRTINHAESGNERLQTQLADGAPHGVEIHYGAAECAKKLRYIF